MVKKEKITLKKLLALPSIKAYTVVKVNDIAQISIIELETRVVYGDISE